jgi:hypothetical protein
MIDYLVDNGFALDIMRMLTAENEYADVEALEKLDRHSNRLRGMTVKHLEFVAEFGNVSGPVEKGKHVLSPFPEFFLAWKLAGYPGMAGGQLARLYEKSKKF